MIYKIIFRTIFKTTICWKAYYVLNTESSSMKKTDQNPCSHGLWSHRERKTIKANTANKQAVTLLGDNRLQKNRAD